MFIFCLKTSHAMGMGHFFRMINLHRAMETHHVNVVFVMLGAHEPAQRWLANAGITYEVVDASSPGWEADLIKRYRAEVWINDRLATDAEHVIAVKQAGLRVVTFDDTGSGAEHADVHVSALGEARGETPAGKQVLMGLDYLILPEEIKRYRRQRHSADSLVVCLGGSDTYGMTVMVASWLAANQRSATLVLGPGFMHEEALAKVLNDKLKISRSPASLMEAFSRHDLAVTAGGLTAFEAAAAGLPTLTIANELHEVGHCHYLERLGCSIYTGYRDSAELSRLDDIDVPAMSARGMQSISTEGAENIIRELL
jgi:spore coat polysaccharide biosynthesis predicted glycosyltransferase SpsG